MFLNLSTLIIWLQILLAGSEKPLMCYFAAYSFRRPDWAKFSPELIDVNLCTHLIYAHLGIGTDSTFIVSTDPILDLETSRGYGLIKRTIDLKKKNPYLKILFSLGGWEVGSTKFSIITKSEKTRKQFIQNIIMEIKSGNWDGVDMNWMYPNHRGGKMEDIANYVKLLKELKTEMKKHGYILVALMSGNEYIFKRAYDLVGMAEQLDYILLLSYDLHGFWDGKTGAFAPLRSSDPLSVTSAVNQYLDSGVPREKILLGFGTHGRTFTAIHNFKEDSKDSKAEVAESPAWSEEKGFIGVNGTSAVEEYMRVGVPKDKLLLGFGTHGRSFIAQNDFQDNYLGVPANDSFSTPWTGEKGFMGFNEICRDLTRSEMWSEHWHSYSSTPFIVKGRQLVSYDDEKSYLAKLNYLKEMDLGGAMVWSLDTDDFRGDCYDKKFYLTSIIKRELGNKDMAVVELPAGPEAQSEEEEVIPPLTIISMYIINILYDS